MEKSDTTMAQSHVELVVAEPLQSRIFRPISNSNRETLKEAWPLVKSSLEQLGHSCSMNTVDYSTVLVESPCSADPATMRKAHYLFELLCKTPVPPPLAIELALHGSQHDVINLGTQSGGMCNKYGISQEKFNKLQIGLKHSLKELEDLTHCTLFLNKNTLTAVGPSPRLWWVRNIWKFSITGNLSPAHVIKVFNRKLNRTTMMMGNTNTMMMEKSDFCVLEQPKVNHEVNDPIQLEKRRSLRLSSPENRDKLKEAWPMVESSLEELGYLCAMSTVDSTVLLVSPCSTDPDIMCKAQCLFKLLCKTPVPAPLAIELALHGRQHDLIELGTQKGGICRKYGINEEKFLKLRRRLKRSLKELEDLTHCTLFLNKNTLTAVGPSPRLCWVRKVWKYSITGKLSPAHVIKVFKWKLKRKTTMMGNSDTMMTEKSGYCVLEQLKVNIEDSDPFPSENRDTVMFENSDFCVLEQPKFNDEVCDSLPLENSNTMMLEKSDICILEQQKIDHVVSDPFSIMEESNFGVLDQPKFSHEAGHPLPTENSKSFRPISAINQAKLKEAWPMIESSLEELGFLCAMSTVDSTVSLVLPWSTDPDIMRKADYLFKLLFKTPVPAPLAIELALRGRQHDLIKLGTQKGGICKKYGMNKENLNKLWRGLRRSLKEFEYLTHCTLFLNKKTLTAVGPSSRLGCVRRVLKFCIMDKLSPSQVISVFICKYDQRIPFVRELDVLCFKKTGNLVNKDGAAEVTFSFIEGRATRMEAALSMVESSLEKHGISCMLNLLNHTVAISKTEAREEYPDAFEKARHLLQLLTTTNVPPSLAIDLALNGKQHEFIEMGFQEGGLCSIYGIKKEQYLKRLSWLTHSVDGIKELTGCGGIYCSVSGDTITAVSPSCVGLTLFREIVLTCIVEDMDPAYLIRKESTRKLQKRVKRLLA